MQLIKKNTFKREKRKAVPTNLSVPSRASSPSGKVPRNWHVGHRCCLYRTMTCRICVEIKTLYNKSADNLTLLLCWRSKPPLPSLLCYSTASSSSPPPRPLSLSLSLSPVSLPHSLLEEVRFLSFSPLFSLLSLQTSRKCLEYHGRRRRCAAAVRLWEVLRSRHGGVIDRRAQPTREPDLLLLSLSFSLRSRPLFFLVAGASLGFSRIKVVQINSSWFKHDCLRRDADWSV